MMINPALQHMQDGGDGGGVPALRLRARGYQSPIRDVDSIVTVDPTARPTPQIVPTIQLLADWGVRWGLTGSTVLAIYGARLVPNDLDVTPALEPDNLHRLAGALQDIDAVPAFVPDWPQGLSLANAGPGARSRRPSRTWTTCS
jgi:hypothetical protein